MEYALAVLSAITSVGFLEFIKFLITRKDEKNNKQDNLETKMEELCEKIDNIRDREDELERSALRTQLLILMQHHGSRCDEILEAGKKYFVDLHGNSFLRKIFMAWLKEQGVDTPDWFKWEEDQK